MAFCTGCGATVSGAFCNQCGTPTGAAARPASPGPAAPQPFDAPASQSFAPPAPQPFTQGPPQPVPGAVAARKTNPIVWVLVIVLGLFVLGGIGVVGTGLFIAHKVRQAGLDPELMRRNPGLAVGKLLAAANPDVDVVSTDDGAGTITVRDKKTGKEATMSFDQAKSGKFTFSAVGDDGKTASVEIGAGAGKLPSWVPAYPGAEAKGTFSVKGDDGNGTGEGGSFAFSTTDSPAKVKAFYEDKCKEAGMKVNVTINSEQGSILLASDEGERHTLHITVAGGTGETGVNVIYGAKR